MLQHNGSRFESQSPTLVELACCGMLLDTPLFGAGKAPNPGAQLFVFDADWLYHDSVYTDE